MSSIFIKGTISMTGNLVKEFTNGGMGHITKESFMMTSEMGMVK
jgi:hypothetical protein